MTLRSRILLILLAVVVLYALSSFWIMRLVVYPSYISLERREAEKDLTRCQEALRREIHHLNSLTHDWAASDDTYRFTAEQSETFIASNLLFHTFMDNRINLLYICTPDGDVIWGEIWDLESKETLALPQFPADGLPGDHILLQPDDAEAAVAGVMMTDAAPLLLASRPIVTSDHDGPIRGYLIIGRFLDASLIRILAEQTRVTHHYRSVDADTMPETDRTALARMSGPSPLLFVPAGDDILHVYTTIRDIYDRTVLLLRADIPREIRARGVATFRFAFGAVCLAGILVLAVLLVLLRRVVVNPLSRLTERIVKIGETGEVLPPLFLNRKDEIGTLCRHFNRLLTRLHAVHNGLAASNEQLQHEVGERKRYEEKLLVRQDQLRELSAKLLLTEERERRRIASELHDRIGQGLAISKLQLGLLIQTGPPDNLGEKMTEIEEMIDRILQETRTLTFEISPPVLYELGLAAAIEWLAEQMAEKHDLRIVVRKEGNEMPVEDNFRVLVFQAVREILINTVKHAGADQVVIRIGREDARMRIDVTDDGVGFDPAHIGNVTGYGLFSIRERLAPLGGQFDIDSVPGAGTHAILRIPLREAEQQETQLKSGSIP